MFVVVANYPFFDIYSEVRSSDEAINIYHDAIDEGAHHVHIASNTTGELFVTYDYEDKNENGFTVTQWVCADWKGEQGNGI